MVDKDDCWKALEAHFNDEGRHIDMRELFKKEGKDRAEKYSVKVNEPSIFLDYSKNLVNEETMALLLNLAKERGVEEWRDRMFAGEHINCTEDRAVMHMALRNQSSEPMFVDGENVMPMVREELSKMKDISDRIRKGVWKGCRGKRITDIVNIGIGGSDLGPKMAYEALLHFKHPEINVHFVSNVDGTQIAETLKGLSWDQTIFIIVSKTFSTQETMMNACSAKKWFLKSRSDCGGDHEDRDISLHFCAVSSNSEAVRGFGIARENIVQFWDWVGGRYSVWGAVGLSLMISVGWENFNEFLMGGHKMDLHFKNTPARQNMPIILALLGVWYNNFWGAQSLAILPYEQYLHRFSAYLQQADMESNGKSIDRQGNPVNKIQTGPIVWGEPGTNGQHAFYQLLHQGTKFVPVDFLCAKESLNPIDRHHKVLLANCIAQSEALMIGQHAQSQGPDASSSKNKFSHDYFAGNKPTNTLLYKQMSPSVLGALIALYEHKIFIQGIIWNINSFDQWGVELGKKLAKQILIDMDLDDDDNTLGGLGASKHDASTASLLQHIKQ